MNVRWILLATALIAFSGAAASARPPQAAPPTLDNAVRISSSADRAEVYLGEALTLTLEYWELSVRGLKVQPFYRGGSITLPAMEGFYAGPLETENDDAARDGALYSVTRYRQRLYPAAAGDLEIGPWRWQGSVRGYTASGAQTQSVDLSTKAIPVRVLPLPAPPSTFRGAVGEFEIALSLSNPDMKQGTPATLTVTVTGSGNPGTLEAPVLPESDWYSLGDPTEDVEPVPAPRTGKFTKQFRYDLMPLSPGNFNFPAVSLTYFSPSARQYKSVRTQVVAVRVAASGPAESLVVIGGLAGSGGGPALMEDGKLALARDTPALAVRRERPGVWRALIALPPLAWLAVVLIGGGWRTMLAWRWPRRGDSNLVVQLAALGSHPQPVEALHGFVRGVLTRQLGDPAAGMSDPEIGAWMEGRIGAEAAACIAEVLRACQDHRYGKRSLSAADLGDLVQGLPEALEAVSRLRGAQS